MVLLFVLIVGVSAVSVAQQDALAIVNCGTTTCVTLSNSINLTLPSQVIEGPLLHDRLGSDQSYPNLLPLSTRVCVWGRTANRRLYFACSLITLDLLNASAVPLTLIWNSTSDQYNGDVGKSSGLAVIRGGDAACFIYNDLTSNFPRMQCVFFSGASFETLDVTPPSQDLAIVTGPFSNSIYRYQATVVCAARANMPADAYCLFPNKRALVSMQSLGANPFPGNQNPYFDFSSSYSNNVGGTRFCFSLSDHSGGQTTYFCLDWSNMDLSNSQTPCLGGSPTLDVSCFAPYAQQDSTQMINCVQYPYSGSAYSWNISMPRLWQRQGDGTFVYSQLQKMEVGRSFVCWIVTGVNWPETQSPLRMGCSRIDGTSPVSVNFTSYEEASPINLGLLNGTQFSQDWVILQTSNLVCACAQTSLLCLNAANMNASAVLNVSALGSGYGSYADDHEFLSNDVIVANTDGSSYAFLTTTLPLEVYPFASAGYMVGFFPIVPDPTPTQPPAPVGCDKHTVCADCVLDAKCVYSVALTLCVPRNLSDLALALDQSKIWSVSGLQTTMRCPTTTTTTFTSTSTTTETTTTQTSTTQTTTTQTSTTVPTTTTPPPPATATTSVQTTAPSEPIGRLVAIVLGSLGGVFVVSAIIVIIVFCYCRRRKAKPASYQAIPNPVQ